MSLDLEKISKLTSFVEALISMREIENSLNDEVISELINEAVMIGKADFTDEEKEQAKRDIEWKFQIFADPGYSLLGDYEQEKWYDDAKNEIEHQFWTRYKKYLIDDKHFAPSVVSTLSEDTLDQKLMNCLLDPKKDYPKPVLRRGLIIGDIQSGKTSTYIGFMCKAADAGYKVFIILTGTIESLRKQTQERVEEGFIGINMSANKTGGERVGVGLDNKPIRAMSMTSRINDFTGNNDKIAVSLAANKDAVVFVIKKNTTTLQKLTKWLLTLNANPATKKIDMPMLMIDDEADNASINTNDKEDPTKINKLIRELASIFTKSNYVGFTATPFANVFIDPETDETMETQDLFPEDFIVALPTPNNYIGADKIFAADGEHHSQLMYITDAGCEEEDGYPFYFKHKKDWKGELPNSLTDAIYTFYLANAIRDLRGDSKQHRSMLINISRFIKVQNYIKGEVEDIHTDAFRAIRYDLSHDLDESLKNPIIKRLYDNWTKHYSDCEFSWDRIVDVLADSIENIQIKVVNTKNKDKLEYKKNNPVRVIAIGGLALSRGLTLEGLITSYFYRNTCTYDVLMQMGRWFGYRKNYEDLFRIWIHKSSARWYAEISEATNKLKADMEIMRERELRPRDFGIRVRNDSSELKITAYNKMKNATDEYEFSSYFGDIVESPYLCLNAETNKANYKAVKKLAEEEVNNGAAFHRQDVSSGKGHYIIRNVAKEKIVDLLHKIKVSRCNPDFDPMQIADFLENCSDNAVSQFDIGFMEGKDENNYEVIAGKRIPKVVRQHCQIKNAENSLGIGRKGRLGGPGDGKTCLVDYNGKTSEEIQEAAKARYRDWYKEKKKVDFTADKTYPSETWFKFVKDRNPLLLIYLLDIELDAEEENQKKQVAEFKDAMGDVPAVGFAIGFPEVENAEMISSTKYKANKAYNWFEREEILAEGEEEE